MVLFPETQRVHRSDGPRAHGEHVSQDAANARGSPLRGFDVGGVIVAFHLENHGLSVADIDDPRILAGAANDLRPLCRKGAQPFLGRFVGTMLVPHGRKDAKLGKARLPSDDLKDAVIFVRRQAMGGDEVGCNGRFGHAVPLGLGAF
jgi:hypothetical protein